MNDPQVAIAQDVIHSLGIKVANLSIDNAQLEAQLRQAQHEVDRLRNLLAEQGQRAEEVTTDAATDGATLA